MRTCPYCRSQIPDDVPFCTHCGAYISEQGTQGQPAPQQYQQNVPPNHSYSPGRPKKGNQLAVILVVFGIIIAAFGGVLLLSNMANDTPSSSTEHKMDYSWDFYTNDTDHVHYTYTLTVPNDYYDKIKKTTIDREGTESDVHLETSKGTVFAVNEYIVVDEYIVKVSKALRALYDADKGSKIPNTTDFASFVMAFVQGSITYQEDSKYTDGKYSEYWKYPLETLCDMKGDCEDTSILMAALLNASETSKDSAVKYSAGIFLIPGHAMCAVNSADIDPSETRKDDSGIRFDYYPIESTASDNSTYMIGTIASEYTGDYFHLYTGYSSVYYGVTSS